MLALVREVSPNLAKCELSYLERTAIDDARAVRQHNEYTRALQSLGCALEWLPPLVQHPDGVFVEDTAVLLRQVAVVTRPGAVARRGETASVEEALGRRIPLLHISEPGCLEGGDVLLIERTLYVGASGRTNQAGISQLTSALDPFGYRVQAVNMQGCLHLKSACTYIAPGVLLVNPAWVEPAAFACPVVIEVEESEPYAANTLTVGATTLVSSAYPRTERRLQAAGVRTRSVDVSELHKAEAALTCMSLLLEPSVTLKPGH
jgi:dimethylargininase